MVLDDYHIHGKIYMVFQGTLKNTMVQCPEKYLRNNMVYVLYYGNECTCAIILHSTPSYFKNTIHGDLTCNLQYLFQGTFEEPQYYHGKCPKTWYCMRLDD